MLRKLGASRLSIYNEKTSSRSEPQIPPGEPRSKQLSSILKNRSQHSAEPVAPQAANLS
jgi:hypothetical protein